MKQSLEEKFWARVDKNGPVVYPELGNCWVWTGFVDSCGYGQIYAGGHTMLAHRVAWELFHRRSIPKGGWILHKCDNPSCVRHLYLGTPADNTRDSVIRGRHKVPSSRKLSDEDVREIMFADGPHAEIAKRYGVGRSTVSNIKNGRIGRKNFSPFLSTRNQGGANAR